MCAEHVTRCWPQETFHYWIGYGPNLASYVPTSCSVEPRHRLPIAAKHAAVEVRLESAVRLAREDVQLDGDEGTVCRVEDRRGLRDADEALAHDSSRVARDGELRIISGHVARLRIAIPHLSVHGREINPVVANQRIHPVHELAQRLTHHEVGALVLNACTGACTARPMRRSVKRKLLPVRPGFCSLPDSANSFLMIARLSRNQLYG